MRSIKISPFRLAFLYSVVSTTSVITISLIEGTLWNENIHVIDGIAFVQYPFLQNVSTIADFVFLNPTMIYFMLRANIGFLHAANHFHRDIGPSPFNKIGLILVSSVVGFSAMAFYFSDFLGEKFFTAAFEPNANGVAQLSYTGLIIFFMTAPIISSLVFFIFQMLVYIKFVRSLTNKDIVFKLLPNLSADTKIAIYPCVQAAYVLTTLFVVLLVFVFRDFYQFSIEQSNRVWSFAPYIIACLIIFLPFKHLHNIMKENKNIIIEESTAALQKTVISKTGSGNSNSKIDATKLRESLDDIIKLKEFYQTIPVWPISFDKILLPNISFVISSVTILYKTATLISNFGQ